MNSKDQYQFFLDAGPLKNLNKYFQYESVDNASPKNEDKIDDFFWKEITEHLIMMKFGKVKELYNI